MDWAFVIGLIANYEPLVACDDAIIRPAAGGGFEVANADSGELLYELGLRNGDVMVSVNSYPLDSFDAASVVFSELVSNNVSDYVLEIERNSTPLTLTYALGVSQ